MIKSEYDEVVRKILYHIEDLAEALDQHTRALSVLHGEIVAIAQKVGARLPETGFRWDIEPDALHKKRIFDADIIDTRDTGVITYKESR